MRSRVKRGNKLTFTITLVFIYLNYYRFTTCKYRS